MAARERKINKLSGFLREEQEGILITSVRNRQYFSGFYSSEGVMLVTRQQVYLLVDFRYGEAASSQVDKACNVIVFRDFYADLRALLTKHGIVKIYIEAKQMSIQKYNQFVSKLPGVTFDTSPALDMEIEHIRIIKTEAELRKIQKAQQITEQSYTEVLNYIKPGVPERKIALELEHLMRMNGAEGAAFDLITITGTKTSLPHGVPDDTLIQQGDLFLMDIGAVYEGYHSDMTRTVAVGAASDYQKEIYNIVLQAQLKGLRLVKAGISAAEVDKAVRDQIIGHGYGSYFGHSTGHGVGMEIHENPTVAPNSKTLLSASMVITVEPGIYLPGQFGVRIEDMVAVTNNGYMNFATLPKELIII